MAERPERGLVQRHLLGVGQRPQQGAVFLVQSQIHCHYPMVPLWYHRSASRSAGQCSADSLQHPYPQPDTHYFRQLRACSGPGGAPVGPSG